MHNISGNSDQECAVEIILFLNYNFEKLSPCEFRKGYI
jgi:hypothetical protein